MLPVPMFLVLAILSTISIFSLLFLFIRSHYMVISVNQQSMSPTFVPGDRILASQHWSLDQLRKGQIVVLKLDQLEPSVVGPRSSSSTLYIKRIVGVGGETFVTTQEGEELVPHDYEPENPEQHLWHIADSSVLVRGDNRINSCDSHIWGPISVRCIQAVMLVRLQRNASARYSQQFMQSSTQSSVLGQNAPTFKASTMQGKIVTLQTYRGRPLLLIFFQPADILKAPFFHHRIKELEMAKDETQIVLVSGSNAKKTCAFLKEVQVDLPVIIAHRSKNDMFQDYKIDAFPSYYSIDEGGKVLSVGVLPITIEPRLVRK